MDLRERLQQQLADEAEKAATEASKRQAEQQAAAREHQQKEAEINTATLRYNDEAMRFSNTLGEMIHMRQDLLGLADILRKVGSTEITSFNQTLRGYETHWNGSDEDAESYKVALDTRFDGLLLAWSDPTRPYTYQEPRPFWRRQAPIEVRPNAFLFAGIVRPGYPGTYPPPPHSRAPQRKNYPSLISAYTTVKENFTKLLDEPNYGKHPVAQYPAWVFNPISTPHNINPDIATEIADKFQQSVINLVTNENLLK